jgi:hypothetical protein
MRSFAVFICWALLLVVSAIAQTDQATLRGTATDPTGAVVVNAKIELVNTGTNIARSVLTGENGDFELPYIDPGAYKLSASAPGFRVFVAEDILLFARETRRLNINFEVGGTGSEITVNAGAAVIATEGSQITASVTHDAWVDGPTSISTGFPQTYMNLLPNMQVMQGGTGLTFAGHAQGQASQSLDGVVHDGSYDLVQNMNDFNDMEVVAAGNSAEYARVGTIAMSGRSGANQLHGRLDADAINSALNARSTFSPTKTPSKTWAGYAELSGPIRRNKTFFYASYTMQRIPATTFYTSNVPTLQMRNGDFTWSANTIKDPLTGMPFPGNVLPPSRVNTTSAKVQSQYLPVPNLGSPSSRTQNLGWTWPWTSDLYKWDAVTDRVDHHFNDKNTLFGRYTNRITPYALAGPLPDVGAWTRSRYHHAVVVNDTHIFSPHLVNTARWGWLKDYIVDGNEEDGLVPKTGQSVVQAIGLQGVNPKNYSQMGFPTMAITGITTLSSNSGGVSLGRRDLTYTDNLTFTRGRHVMKFGGELKTYRDYNSVISSDVYGNFSFNGQLSGEPYADFLLGHPFTSTLLNPLVPRVRHSYELGIFWTDTFKVNSRLSVDYGLRWDYFGATNYDDGLLYNWDPATGNVIVPQSKLSAISPLWDPKINTVAGSPIPGSKKANFGPRVGVAYQLQKDLVLRGGYGLYTETLGNFARAGCTIGQPCSIYPSGGPFQISQTYTNNLQPLFSFPNPFPSRTANIPSQNITGIPTDTSNGRIHQFNVSVEKQVGSVGLRLSYIGSRDKGLNYGMNINKPQPSLIPFTQSRRPNPQFVNATYYYSDGQAKYDSMQIEAKRRMGHVTFDVYYTLANSMNNTSDLENPYNHLMWSRDSLISRQRAVGNVTYDVPLRPTSSGVLNHVIGGWKANWITVLNTGQYFSPSFSGSDPSNTNTSGGLPDRIGNGNLPPGDRKNWQWFDASAFVVPQPGHFGNSGANVLEGPGTAVHHASLLKNFQLTERFRLTFIALGTDIFNTPCYGFPYSNISVPGQVGHVYTAGFYWGANGGRSVSFKLRLDF